MPEVSTSAYPARETGESLPRVTVIIPIPPTMDRPRALEALARLSYPADRWELILARGSQPSRQRNTAAAAAGGEYLFFLDDDSLAEPDLIEHALKYYRDETTACVGGPNIEFDEKGTTGMAINCVLASLFGDVRGCKRFARRGAARPVGEDGLILCNMNVSKALFDRIGGFPEQLYPNEENAFFARVLRSVPGSRLMYAPDAFVRRARPSTVREFVRKIFGYGVGRLRQTFVSPSWVCALRLSVGLFPVYWLVMPFVSGRLALASLALYLAGDALMAVRIFFDVRSASVAALSALLFPAMHLSYGLGLWWGLISKALHLRRIREGRVDLVFAKRFSDDRIASV
jgi:succinoglycan biosynthesis protein ExoA